ncbi:hypothetical protein Metme_3620 [Methylomonas methanica MC09]|uniref:Uncharacterized protein n=1 Tax=Methylomonas methanica (strain DSM 25384 / MC09) TaxID=857087 RepID=F9ZVJ9_METMM|nr:hypothetical protein Metme_3620 [Methylomonas methanica MC09]
MLLLLIIRRLQSFGRLGRFEKAWLLPAWLLPRMARLLILFVPFRITGGAGFGRFTKLGCFVSEQVGFIG